MFFVDQTIKFIESAIHDSKTELVSNYLEELSDYEQFNILDIYPYQILDNDKFEQIEIFFDKLTEEDFSRKTEDYLLYNSKLKSFERVIQHLWLINDKFYVFYNNEYNILSTSCDTLAHKIYREEIENIKSLGCDETNLKEVREYSSLVSLVRLAVAERLSLFFILINQKIIIQSNGLSFIIYSDQKLDDIEKIANVEGLYIR
ncbi:hypothetical protein [Anoxybacteroides rupiense]|uniref:Uncharacterized protein n=1 Tax=Anoxybacteroides rupiense TaxID=311460 RepID=A0ABD5IWH7_9BACL|nr:hypothetical protein [Anoxybacillus rupiensis]MED5052164.1 hypothetical protein [Anoxybacillus rupiensis]